jgi:hypothetical protein
MGDNEIRFLCFTGQLLNTTELVLYFEIPIGTLVLLQGEISFKIGKGKSDTTGSIAREPKLLNNINILTAR